MTTDHRAALAQPEPEGLTDADTEKAAAIIYESMRLGAGPLSTPPWMEHGNSLMQDEARRSACAILARYGRPAVPPVAQPEPEGLFGLDDLRNAWNAQADAANRWDELGMDEIIWFAQQQALARYGRPAVEDTGESVVIPDELHQIGHRLRTQDNRCTADPIFQVQVKERIYGFDSSYSDGFEWKDDDHNSIEIPEGADPDSPPNGVTVVHYTTIWRVVMAAFTEEACKEHLRLNGHNYRGEVRIYTDSLRRCPEMIAIRRFLMELSMPPGQVATALHPRPAVEPVAVADRQPSVEAGDLDNQGRCWWGDAGDEQFVPSWRLCEQPDDSHFTHWKPHWAIPVPTTPQEPQS